MKKTPIFKLIFMMIAMVLSGIAVAQPTGQFAIGDGRNQTATNVKVLPDGSGTIIAGYEYDITGSDVSDAKIILMKVNPSGTAILWQERIGVAKKNNLTQNMIITHDNNIVIVGTIGRDGVFDKNVAAIMKFSSLDGHLIWQSNLYDKAGTIGGEVFNGVTELGASRNYDLVAVGAHDFRPNGSDAMICLFQSNGTFVYEEDWAAPSSDGYQSVCTDANGKDVYLCGIQVGDYMDVRVEYYHPYATATSGSINWSKQFDYALPGVVVKNGTITPGSLYLQDNFFTNIYLSGSKLIIHGGSLHDYSSTSGEGESIARMNADGTGSAELWQIQNSNLDYANTSKIAVVNSDHLFNVQMPATSSIDPIIWLSGTNTDAIVTEVTSLTGTGPGVGSHSTLKTPMRYTTPQGGIHSLFDITLSNSNTRLTMAGCTNDAKNNGNNDVYLVMSPTTPPSATATIAKDECDAEDIGGCLQVAITPITVSYERKSFVPDFVLLDPEPTQYNIIPLCEGKVKCADSTDLSVVTSVDAEGNCVFTVTASVTTSGTVKGYEWTMPGGAVMQVFTSATSNTQVVTLPMGGADIVNVRVLIVSDYWDEGGSPCCEINLRKQLVCSKNPCDGITPPVITATSMLDADGICEPAFTSSVYPVTIDFSANVSSASPYWTCGAFLGSKVLYGPGPEIMSPCDVALGAWSAAACTPATPYPCPLSPGNTTHINFMVVTQVTYMGCPFTIHVPIDPVCPPAPKPSGDGATKTSAKLSVTPNPTDGVLEVSGMIGETSDKEVLIEITDMLGKTILSDKCQSSKGMISKKITLDNTLANGVYLIKVSGGKLNETVRFTVNK